MAAGDRSRKNRHGQLLGPPDLVRQVDCPETGRSSSTAPGKRESPVHRPFGPAYAVLTIVRLTTAAFRFKTSAITWPRRRPSPLVISANRTWCRRQIGDRPALRHPHRNPGSETYHSRLDSSIVLWLSERADFTQLAERNAPLTQDISATWSWRFRARWFTTTRPFAIAASRRPRNRRRGGDLLIRCEAIHRVLCGAVARRLGSWVHGH